MIMKFIAKNVMMEHTLNTYIALQRIHTLTRSVHLVHPEHTLNHLELISAHHVLLEQHHQLVRRPAPPAHPAQKENTEKLDVRARNAWLGHIQIL
jgi:hypothetical protein